MGIILFKDVLLFDLQSFTELSLRLVLNCAVIYIVIFAIYYRKNKNAEYVLAFAVLNILIFFASSLLSHLRMETGFAFGLFAIFSILRYRTEQIKIKEMTFLFAVIIIAVINSLVTYKVALASIIFTDFVILMVLYYFESLFLQNAEKSMLVRYEKIELVAPEKREDLIIDLVKRTGLKIQSVEIESINLLQDTAQIKVTYHS